MSSYGSAETKPLNGGNASDNDKSKGGLPCSKSNLAMGGLVAAVLVLYFGFPTSNTVGVNDITSKGSTIPAPKSPDIDKEEAVAKVMYRPFCTHHGGKGTSARLLQTSMQNPSQQWTALPCYNQNDNGAKATEKYDFGAPDAALQVNFSQLAFERRETPILGFGGAFTEAASLNFHSLSWEGQETVLELLFGKSGLGYSQGRVHINSCDFSVKSYSFDETEDDFELEDFDDGVHHDVESGMVDFALRATSRFREAWASDDGLDGELKLYASPWSPPKWMKAPSPDDDPNAEHSESMLNSAAPTCIREGTGKESKYAKAWALYFSKFISACKLCPQIACFYLN